MVNHEYNCSAINAQEMTAATMHGRAEIHRSIAALRQLGGPYEGLQLVSSAVHIGIREGRRIRGRY